MSQIKLSENFIKNTVKLALNEDLYPSGDITSSLVKNNKINGLLDFGDSIYAPTINDLAICLSYALMNNNNIFWIKIPLIIKF